MSRAWEPGDVAMWSVDDCADEIVFRYVDYTNNNEHAWATVDSGDGYPREGELRPLVVIDPEDREQVGRLLSIIRPGAMGGIDILAAHLREFADPTPPIPPEPTGLGAVVERHDGRRWVRREDGQWTNLDAEGMYLNWSSWSEISEGSPVVRVLSEGVTA